MVLITPPWKKLNVKRPDAMPAGLRWRGIVKAVKA
jgi:hypothetical protein